MCALLREIKFYERSGMDNDSAIEYRDKNDYGFAYNIRPTGTQSLEAGYITNINSNEALAASVSPGINRCIGSAGFETLRIGLAWEFNSAGYHQIRKIDYDTNNVTVLFTDILDTGGTPIMPLNPQYYVDDIKLVNDTYLIWNDAFNTIGFTNLNTLESGGYGIVLAEDFSLIKPQPLPPPTGSYISDAGRASNFCKGKLFQFLAQWIGYDFTKSAWSTHSKRIIPTEESTPLVGTSVIENNGIVVGVDAGSIRVQTINIGMHSGDDTVFSTIRSVDRTYVIALPDTSVSATGQIYEAYDPATNVYSFIFYNNDQTIPINTLETDLAFDDVPQSAGALEVVNGNIIALGDLNEGYARPATNVTIQAVGYDPNINVPTNISLDPLYRGTAGTTIVMVGFSFKSRTTVQFGGTPATNDSLTITLVDTTNTANVLQYVYTVPSGQAGDLSAVITSFTATIPGASFVNNGDGTYTIIIIADYKYKLQSAYVTLYNAGVTVSRSIHAILDNSSYTLALSYRDTYGRYFPLDTDNTFKVQTPSYAQLNGQAVELNWTINTAAVPANAVDYQWLITQNNTAITLLDVLASTLNYISTWDAHANTPTLAPGTGTVGDAYQITTPSIPSDNRNLGNGVQEFKTGDYVVYNGQSWDIVDKTFGDLTTAGNLLAFKINPLQAFNDKYTNAGANTVLTYDFSPGDRCTLHYYQSGSSAPVFINSPCVDLSVFGYDAATNIVKMEKSATFDETLLSGNNTYIRLYSPKPATQDASATENTVLWYEIGERFTITNGVHDTLSGTITDGDVYFKTRQYSGAIDPNSAYEVLATDFNFSDFYASAFTSYGRPRSYNDVLEISERKAIITWSQQYILGSKNNGLTRFYPENVYGTNGGETSANWGAIRKLLQINNQLFCGQELNHGSIPVYGNLIETTTETTGIAISQKLFNNINYTAGKHIGLGNAKDSVAVYQNVIYWIDPHRSEPIRWAGNGAIPISGKLSKFFKNTLQAAYSAGLKIIGWYDIFYNEYVISIQQPGGQVQSFAFNPATWQFEASYSVLPGAITITTPPTHSSASYNTVTGIAVITPASGYVGSDTMVISFGAVTKNVCFNWTAGTTDVNPFSFNPAFGQELSVYVLGNTISVSGPTVPVPISITGGLYSVNGGSFVSTPGTVNAGDIIQVECMSSASLSTTTSTTLTIGSQMGTFDVTTKSSSAAHFTVSAQYGYTIESVVATTAVGIPGSLASISVAPGSNLSVPYTAVTGGGIDVTLSGSPAIPGHIKLDLYYIGVLQDSIVTPMASTYGMTIPDGADPNDFLIGVDSF